MKHRAFILVALAAIPFTIAAGQVPPIPPTPPNPPVQPDPVIGVPPSKPVPPAAIAPPPGVRYIRDRDRLMDLDEIRRSAEDAKWAAQDAIRGLDMAKISRDASLAAQEAMRGIDFARISEDAKWAAQGAMRNLDMAKISHDASMAAQSAIHAIDVPRIAANAKFAAQSAMVMPPRDFNFNFDFDYSNAKAGQGSYKWVQGDPADSIYQLAREAFNRQDYSRAAARFAEVVSKYPNFRRIADAAYYEAFARYRVGTVEHLRLALKVLETNAGRLAYDPKANDATVLQARVLRSLVDRNEPGADAKLKDLYARYPAATCDSELISIKSQVLNSLYQSDPEAALPAIRSYLATRDACTADLRKASVFLLANRPTDQNTALIINVAKTDTVREVRTQAIEILSRMPSDAAINALQELMRDNDERVSRAAVRSLMRSDNVKARSALRSSLLDRRDATENQRIEAIQSYDRENTTPDDAAYLRNLYNRKDESDRIKDAVISVLSRIPTEENVKFLLGIAQNPNESSSLRARALRSISRTTLSIDDLVKLYDASDSRSMRQSLVEALSNRKEEAAVNKLLEIVKYSTDPEVRRYTIQILLNKNDQAITKKVLDLIK